MSVRYYLEVWSTLSLLFLLSYIQLSTMYVIPLPPVVPVTSISAGGQGGCHQPPTLSTGVCTKVWYSGHQHSPSVVPDCRSNRTCSLMPLLGGFLRHDGLYHCKLALSGYFITAEGKLMPWAYSYYLISALKFWVILERERPGFTEPERWVEMSVLEQWVLGRIVSRSLWLITWGRRGCLGIEQTHWEAFVMTGLKKEEEGLGTSLSGISRGGCDRYCWRCWNDKAYIVDNGMQKTN